ncbi:MAG: YhcB family protein, partial [Gammaproteobacteria bacterium]|nr:YhcB family protein [Gammaproteobacteria bacterium]
MMDNTLIVAGLTFVVGLLVGMGLDRLIRRDAARSRRLAQQVDQTREEYTRYQAQVNEHFMETAQLVKRMNDAYQEVNQHLARGASRLCNDDEWQNSLPWKPDQGS